MCLDRQSDARMNSISLLGYRNSVFATSSIRKEDGTVQVKYSYSVLLARKRALVTIHFLSNVSVMTSLYTFNQLIEVLNFT